MGIIEKWNKFAKKSIYINDTFEISVGRLIFAIILMILGVFQIPVAWLTPVFAVKKKRRKEDNQENDDSQSGQDGNTSEAEITDSTPQ